jgi:hypothetical protein
LAVSTTPTLAQNGGSVAFPVDRVWRVIRSAYDSLAIPVTTFDSPSRTIANAELRVRRRLGEVPLSTYINCGNAQGPPSADTYEVRLSVATQVRADSPGSAFIATTLDARARPITISGEFAQCTTTGALERRVVDLVNLQLRR